MICRDFPSLYSVQIDDCADEHEQLALQEHLRQCVVCRRRAVEMRGLISGLRGLGESREEMTPRARQEMVGQIQSALRREASFQSSQAKERAAWLDLWRTRIFSQSIGAMVSFSLFFLVTVGIFSPVQRAMYLAQAATQVILEDPNSDEIRLRVLLLQPPPPPIFNPSGELLYIGACLSGESDVIATVKVGKDGRASINQIEGAPSDHSVMTRISSVIKQQASFHPPRRDQNTSSEAVVIFSKVNISG